MRVFHPAQTQGKGPKSLLRRRLDSALKINLRIDNAHARYTNVGRNHMTHHLHLDQLAGKLFHVFSRTEYALKAAGYNNGDGAAEANWRTFALAVENLIANPTTQELQEAIGFFFKAPPKKQVIVDGVIQWDVSEPGTNSQADKLLIYVRRVRNNLFHGGRFNGHWFAPERSEPLLRHSLTILAACVEFVPAVSEAYHG